MDIDLNRMLLFNDICNHESLSDAAKVMKIDKSTLSRNISSLEGYFGKKLFNRVNRKLVLTDEGRAVREKVTNLALDLRKLKSDIGSMNNSLSGTLRITTTHPIASTWICKFIHLYMKEHQNLRLEIIASSVPVDLSLREADVALRPFCNMSGLKHEHLYRNESGVLRQT